MFQATPELRRTASRSLYVLPVLGVIAPSCTDAGDGAIGSSTQNFGRSSARARSILGDPVLGRNSVHITMFTSLGAVFWVAFHTVKRKAVLAIAAGWAIGCCSELFQRLFPTRDPSIRDVLINWSSVGAGRAISYCLHQITETRSLNVKTAGHLCGAENMRAELLALSLHIGTQHGAPKEISPERAEKPELVQVTGAQEKPPSLVCF
jgi:hypothetical protein